MDASRIRDNYPRLVDGRTGEEVLITKDIVLIGRHRSCDIILPVVEVSRRHCKIYIDDGVYYVEDLRTVNGTYVNEKAIDQPQLLQEGFHLKVAKCSKFPAGVKNYIFRMPKSMAKAADEALDRETRSLRKDLLNELVDDGNQTVASPRVPEKVAKTTKVELRHCTCRVARKREKPRQVPLVKLDGESFGFLGLHELAVGESLNFTLFHPRWLDEISFTGAVQRVGRLVERPVFQVEGMTQLDQAAVKAFETRIASRQLPKYIA